jgi:putative transcriptional regulator
MNEPILKNTLKVQRAIHDLTQEQLAELVGVSRKSINAIEGNRFVPSTAIALRLAKVHGVSVEAIFSLQETPNQEEKQSNRGFHPVGVPRPPPSEA